MADSRRHPRAIVTVASLLLAVTGCGQATDTVTTAASPASGTSSGGTVDSYPSSGNPRSGNPSSGNDTPAASASAAGASPAAPPSAAAASADLTVVLDDGSGTTTWHLTCNPTGGNHPDPQLACSVLGAQGERALPPVPAGTMCTELYGGPQKATISGTWRGQRVSARFSRTNGCEIARWDALRGLLPSGEA